MQSLNILDISVTFDESNFERLIFIILNKPSNIDLQFTN